MSFSPTSKYLALGFFISSATFAATSEQRTVHLKSIVPFSSSILKSQGHSAPLAHDLQASSTVIVDGGGYGGNELSGVLTYDGLPNHLPSLLIRRNEKDKECLLENNDVSINYYNFWGSLKRVSFDCGEKNISHNNVYWNEKLDKNNGGYSVENDALYANMIVNSMYRDWFGLSALKNEDGSPLKIVVQNSGIESYWDNKNSLIILGNGDKQYYPFTTPPVVSALMAMVLLDQTSKLNFFDAESGALYIAFSTMAAEATTLYMQGTHNWEIGGDISKTGTPIYYFEQPSKDCGSHKPGDSCSIDHLSQYKPTLEPQFASGVYRRAFYLLATSQDWDVKKTFGVLLQANRHHWTAKQNFSDGLCGIIKATRDLNYNESAVIDAFNEVGVTAENC